MKTVGILGGGQLGMMLAEELHNLGAKAICLDPNPRCPASFICDDVVVSNYDDLEGLKKLGSMVDVITYEFENVGADNLNYLANNYNIKQGIRPLFDSQNRLREKENARRLGLNTPRFYSVLNKDDLLKGIGKLGYPCIYKTTTLGYDGHGQVVIKSSGDLSKVDSYLAGEGILEEFIDYDYETSIIMVRDSNKTISFPMTINRHKRGILDLVIAADNKPIFEEIKKASYEFMNKANYYGILTIEFFVKGDKFYFNEMAPRPHNSGHYTIEGCNTNQYRELARFLLDLDLIDPKLISKTIMKNILGYDFDNAKRLKVEDNVYKHLYNKDKVSPFRKMGHITFTNLSISEYEEKYSKYFSED